MPARKRPPYIYASLKKVRSSRLYWYPHMSTPAKINFSRIKQRKIIQLIGLHKLDVVNDFFKLNSLCYDLDDHASYRTHSKTFLVKGDIDHVWEHYKSVSPDQAWNSN